MEMTVITNKYRITNDIMRTRQLIFSHATFSVIKSGFNCMLMLITN